MQREIAFRVPLEFFSSSFRILFKRKLFESLKRSGALFVFTQCQTSIQIYPNIYLNPPDWHSKRSQEAVHRTANPEDAGFRDLKSYLNFSLCLNISIKAEAFTSVLFQSQNDRRVPAELSYSKSL